MRGLTNYKKESGIRNLGKELGLLSWWVWKVGAYSAGEVLEVKFEM